MTVEDFEGKVWAQDNIRIVVRDRGKTAIDTYSHKNAAQANWSINEFIQKRVQPIVGGREVIVLMGNGEVPHGRTLLSSIRASYEK